MLSIRLRYTGSDYPFGIFKLFCDRHHVLISCYFCVTNDHIYFPFVVPEHLSSPLFYFTTLSGVRVVHVIKLYHVFSCVVVMSATISAQKRRLIRIDPLFFCSGFILLLILFVVCYVCWCRSCFHVVQVSVLLSPCLH